MSIKHKWSLFIVLKARLAAEGVRPENMDPNKANLGKRRRVKWNESFQSRLYSTIDSVITEIDNELDDILAEPK